MSDLDQSVKSGAVVPKSRRGRGRGHRGIKPSDTPETLKRKREVNEAWGRIKVTPSDEQHARNASLALSEMKRSTLPDTIVPASDLLSREDSSIVQRDGSSIYQREAAWYVTTPWDFSSQYTKGQRVWKGLIFSVGPISFQFVLESSSDSAVAYQNAKFKILAKPLYTSVAMPFEYRWAFTTYTTLEVLIETSKWHPVHIETSVDPRHEWTTIQFEQVQKTIRLVVQVRIDSTRGPSTLSNFESAPRTARLAYDLIKLANLNQYTDVMFVYDKVLRTDIQGNSVTYGCMPAHSLVLRCGSTWYDKTIKSDNVKLEQGKLFVDMTDRPKWLAEMLVDVYYRGTTRASEDEYSKWTLKEITQLLQLGVEHRLNELTKMGETALIKYLTMHTDQEKEIVQLIDTFHLDDAKNRIEAVKKQLAMILL